MATLVFVQARALLRQFERGFVPLRHEPGREPVSWDMFAIKITRCNVAWSPPLQRLSAGGQPIGPAVTSISDLSPLIEWNPVFDVAPSYAYFARSLCAYVDPGGYTQRTMTLTCFDNDGRKQLNDHCP